MDMLTTAADAILKETSSKHGAIPLTRSKNSRQVLGNITNITKSSQNANLSLGVERGSSFNALFKYKITSNSKMLMKTPGKRRRTTSKYGDENDAPSPKTPKNRVSKKSESPMTPMSNLKLLTRIASMEEPIPSKKSLFENSSKTVNTRNNFRRCYSDNSFIRSASEIASSKPKFKKYSTSCDISCQSGAINLILPSLTLPTEGSRKEKSLGLLCERFLELFPMEISCLETPRRLVIDDVASTLGTERRRVYDIINILECLNMATRVQKNMYLWMGKLHLETTLSRLKGLAQKWGIGTNLTTPIDQYIKEMKPHVVALDTALHLLLGREGDDFDKLRTRGRRIYDIANVLISLQLMKKLPHNKSFMYIGPSVMASHIEDFSDQPIKLRHSLLPPINELFANCVSGARASLGVGASVITPSEIVAPIEKKGNPRKLAKEFVISMVKQGQDFQRGGMKPDMCRRLSLQDICNVTEVERELLQRSQSSEGSLAPPLPLGNALSSSLQHQRKASQTLNVVQLPRLGSPRVALTFQNPPAFIAKQPILKRPQIQVLSRPHQYFNIENGKPQFFTRTNDDKTSVYLMHSQLTPTHSNMVFNSNSKGVFRVYSRQIRDGKSFSSPSASIDDAVPTSNSQPQLNKVLSQTFPNISLNTLARNHYRTVIGKSTNIPEANSSKNAFHFVINANKNGEGIIQKDESGGIEKGRVKSPSFVRIFQTSPDSSSTDSELESIFGDSFKFSRPTTLVEGDWVSK